MPRLRRRLTPLAPDALAEAAVLGALAAVLHLAARLLALGVLGQLVATAPFAVLAARRPYRVVWTGSVVAGVLGFVTGGTGPVITLGIAAMFGWPVGRGIRHGWSVGRVVAVALVTAWPPISAFTVGALALFSRSRELAFENARAQWRGTARLLRRAGLERVADDGERGLEWALAHWWAVVPAVQAGVTVVVALLSYGVCRTLVARVQAAMGDGRGRPLPPPSAGRFRPVPGSLVVLVGPNGCGKTTLLRSLAVRPGTVLVAQRPEAQVLGPTVAEDVRWGLPDLPDEAVSAALARVGMAGSERRDTSTLSGGQLQRLAIAAALVRRPAVLLSDESTAMLDPGGRRELFDLLRSAAHDDGIAVVHATHLAEEIAAADVVVDAADLGLVAR